MSEFKGTPGPWEIMNGGDIFGPPGGDSGDGVKCDRMDGWQVAEVGIYVTFVDGELVELGDAPREANKRLIVKAPELFDIVNAVAHTGADFGHGPFEIGDAEIQKARELITEITEPKR